MSALEQIKDQAKKNGWMILHESFQQLIIFNWRDEVRHEVHVLFDGQHRVRVWSHWENRRRLLDQNPSNRGRLEDFIKFAPVPR